MKRCSESAGQGYGKILPIVMALAAVLLWSSTPTVAGFSTLHTNYYSLTLGMLLTGLLGLGAAVLVQAGDYLRLARGMTWRLAGLIAATGAAMAAYYLLLFYALEHSPSVEASIISFTWPIWFVLLSSWFVKGRRHIVTPKQALLLYVAFIGTALVLIQDQPAGLDSATTAYQGYAAAAVSALFAGAYLVLAQKVKPLMGNYCFVYFTALLFAVPVLYLLPVLMDIDGVASKAAWGFYVYMGLLVFALGQMAWIYAVDKMASVGVAALAYLTPVLSVLLLHLLRKEPLLPGTLFGMLLILCSAILLNTAQKGEKSPPGRL